MLSGIQEQNQEPPYHPVTRRAGPGGGCRRQRPPAGPAVEVEAAAVPASPGAGAEAGERASGAPRRGAGPGPCVGAGESERWLRGVVATREELRRLFL